MAKAELDVTALVEETFEKHFGVTLARLRELAEADRDGRLVELPCKVGDTIYKIPSKENYDLNKINGHPGNNRVYEQKVCSVEFYSGGAYLVRTCDWMDSVHSHFYKKNWFLTREAAEKALEEHK